MRITSKAGLALLLAGSTILAGCTGPGATRIMRGGGSYPAEFARDYLQYAGREGPVLLQVQGDAFAKPPAETAPRLAEMTTGAVFGLPIAFTANREVVREPNWRVIFVFDNAAGASDDALCEGLAPQEMSDQTDNVIAAFCFRDRSYGYVRGYARSFGGLDDPALRDYARQIVREMFPPDREEELRSFDD